MSHLLMEIPSEGNFCVMETYRAVYIYLLRRHVEQTPTNARQTSCRHYLHRTNGLLRENCLSSEITYLFFVFNTHLRKVCTREKRIGWSGPPREKVET